MYITPANKAILIRILSYQFLPCYPNNRRKPSQLLYSHIIMRYPMLDICNSELSHSLPNVGTVRCRRHIQVRKEGGRRYQKGRNKRQPEPGHKEDPKCHHLRGWISRNRRQPERGYRGSKRQFSWRFHYRKLANYIRRGNRRIQGPIW